MNAISAAFLAFVGVGMAWAAEPAETSAIAGPETVLNVAAHHVDSIFVNALASLELIAATPEAKKGDWRGIKAYLKLLDARLPGTYFFVLPDGNYFSVASDYTNLNLSNRPYFKTLFAGHPVKGFPIYSRSSGKKSALMAVPIMVGGKVNGALGASVFLDDLHAALNRQFDLPAGYTWFILDAEGNTMLDRERDFIFMNALTQGSPSLRGAVSFALKQERGTMEYELGGPRHAYYRKLPSMGWLMVLARIEPADMQTPPLLKLSLDRFVPDLQKRLDEIDASLARAIARHEADDKKAGGIREILRFVVAENPDVVDASFVDHKGVLREIEPDDYKNLEDLDVSAREHVAAMLKTRDPVLSRGFLSFEGFLAVELARPVHDSERNFIGAIGAFLRPELLIRPLLRTNAVPADYELWIMQPDGMILFDQDQEEIGKTLFSDPLYADYESLLELGRRIASTPSGEGNYIFNAPGSREKVIKRTAWRTVRLHGREWRVILAWRPYE